MVTGSAATLATLNTGQGAYELYAMNQDVETTDAVTFAGITNSKNMSVSGSVNVTGDVVSGVTCFLYHPTGCLLATNGTCNILYSPDGGTVMESCN